MAHWTHQTEHAGAKNGGGFYGLRVEAKTASKIGRRRNDRAVIEEYLLEEDVQEPPSEPFESTARLTLADLPQGNLFIVSLSEAWESPRIRLTTSSPERAVAAFNAHLEEPENYCDEILMEVSALNEDGDYHLVSRVSRPYLGGIAGHWIPPGVANNTPSG